MLIFFWPLGEYMVKTWITFCLDKALKEIWLHWINYSTKVSHFNYRKFSNCREIEITYNFVSKNILAPLMHP